MVEKAANNIHELPLTDTPSHEDDYDRENRTLLVDMDKEEANNPESNANNQWMLIAVTILVVIMTISYFGYDWYQQQTIAESAASIAAIETTQVKTEKTPSSELAPPINEKNTQVTPVDSSTSVQSENTQPITNAPAQTSQDLLSLINTGAPNSAINNTTSAIKKNISATTPKQSQSMATTERTAPAQIKPTQPDSSTAVVVPDPMLSQLQTTIDNLVNLTGELKNSMSELTFQVDQNNARIIQASKDINATKMRLEKLEKGQTSITKITPTPKINTRSKKVTSVRSWIDQSNVISVRKIGSSFIAKIQTPSEIVRLSVGDQYQGWTVNKIDLNSGAVMFQHQKGQQRSLSL